MYKAEVTVQFSKGSFGSRVLQDDSKQNLYDRISDLLKNVINYSRDTDNHVVGHKIDMKQVMDVGETF